MGGTLGPVSVAPLGDVVLDLGVPVAAADDEGLLVEALTHHVGEGLAVDVEEDVAVVGGNARTAVTDEEVVLLALVDDVALGAQGPAGAGEEALLHGLAACGSSGVTVDAGTVVPEVGRGDFAVLDGSFVAHEVLARLTTEAEKTGA